MIKKIFFASFLFLPSLVFADKLGAIRSTYDVPLATQNFNSTFGNGSFAKSTSFFTNGYGVNVSTPLTIYGQYKVPTGKILMPWYYDSNFSPGSYSLAGYFGFDALSRSFEFLNTESTPIARVQLGGYADAFGYTVPNAFGVLPAGSSYLKNTFDANGSFGVATAKVSHDLTLGDTYYFVRVDASSGSIQIRLPELDVRGAGVDRRWYKICKVDSSTNTVTITPTEVALYAFNDVSEIGDPLSVPNECVDIIGRTDFAGTGSLEKGYWSEAGRMNRNNVYGHVQTINGVYVGGTLDLGLGAMGIQGSTITIAAPPTDTVNRILRLYNGAGSWPAEADGAALSSTQTFTGGNVFTSTNGVGVTYGVTAGSVTVNDVTGGNLAYFDANKKLSTATVSGATFSNGVLTVTGGSGGVSVYPSTAPVLADQGIRTSSVAFFSATDGPGYVMGWSTKPWASGDIAVPALSTPAIQNFSAFLQAGATYQFYASIIVSNSGSSGFKMALDSPTGATFAIRMFGPGTVATAARYGERIDTDLTLHTNFFGTFGNGNHILTMNGSVVMGATSGSVYLCLANSTGSSTVVKQGSYMFLEKRDPTP